MPFSVSSAHEASRAHALAPGAESLAVEPLWQHCLTAGLAGHEGTSLAAAGDAIESKGQVLEAHWPYNPRLGAGTEPEPLDATSATWYCARIEDLPLAHDGIELLAQDALAAGIPLILVIEVTDEFEHPAADGEIATPNLSAPTSDYHAVVAVGVATDLTGVSRRLLIRNTWGSGWGAGGYGWLPLDYLIAFVVQAAFINPGTLDEIGGP